ncbi:MAG: phosphatase PAP2 family protein [Bacteroidota bacterium]|nr:phosphatase PAP2 family protein [Bacteroidota bacterium]
MIKYLLLFFIFPVSLISQNEEKQYSPVPFSNIFYNIDKHLLGSFTYNYGINHLFAAAGSYGIVSSGIDWNIYQFSKDNMGVAYTGFSSVIIGGLTPLLVPLGMYYYGKYEDIEELQITSLALGQAAIISLAVSSGYKLITGRKPPEIFDDEANVKDYSKDFRFGFLNRGVFDGWPSGHTMAAFAMATTLSELYPENTTVKFCAFVYASIIGLGVSTNIHWFSDAFAGALIGYSIGKSVGTGFANLKNRNNKNQSFKFQFIPGGISFSYHF